jgi:hypothetical protein
MHKSASAHDAGLERRGLSLPKGLVDEVQQLLLDLRRDSGKKVSFSSFVEVSVRSLLSDPEVVETLARFGAAARRRSPHREDGPGAL